MTAPGAYPVPCPCPLSPAHAQHADAHPAPAHLMGMMLENRSRKRMICRYQRPAKCCRATMTSDTTTSAPNRILVRQFTSRSKRPIWGQSTGCRGSWCSPHLCGERKSDFHEPAERTPSLLTTACLDLGYNSGAECWSSMHKAQGSSQTKGNVCACSHVCHHATSTPNP